MMCSVQPAPMYDLCQNYLELQKLQKLLTVKNKEKFWLINPKLFFFLSSFYSWFPCETDFSESRDIQN